MGRVRQGLQRKLPGRSLAAGWIGLALLSASPAGAVLSASKDRVEEPLLDAHDQGLGRDLTVAIYEPKACIDRDHPDFDLITFLPRFPQPECNPGSGLNGIVGHATKVTSALATARPDGKGGRRLSGLFAGRVFEADSQDVRSRDFMLEQDPDFVNLSTTVHIHDAWIDEAVWERRIFVANASGNDGADPEDLARCWAYNSLCVGGYDHRDTLGPAGFGDDLHHTGASWRNAPGSGREEPDLVGVYRQHLAWPPRTGQAHGYEGGTSYATPSVLGLAALLTASHRDVLHREPTLLRALLMASASHPLHDHSGKRAGIPIVDDGFDDRSGAGAPRGDRADAIVRARRFFGGRLDRDADFDGDGRLHQSLAFPVAEGERVRVALAWDQCPVATTVDADVLVVDLDLTVRGPDHDLRKDFPTDVDRFLDGYETQSTTTQSETGELTPEAAPEALAGEDDASQPEPGRGRRLGQEKKRELLGALDFLTAPSYSSDLTLNPDPVGDDAGDTSSPLDSVSVLPQEPELALDPTSGADEDAWHTPLQVETVISNVSRVDNYELVEFEAPVGGTYEIEIRSARWDDCRHDLQRGRPGTEAHVAVAWDVF